MAALGRRAVLAHRAVLRHRAAQAPTMAPVRLRFWIGEVQIPTTVTRLPTTNPIMTVLTMIRRTTAALMLAARIMEAPTAAVSMAAEGIIDHDSEIRSAWHCAPARNHRPSSLTDT